MILPIEMRTIQPHDSFLALWTCIVISYDPDDKHSGFGFSLAKSEMDSVYTNWCRDNIDDPKAYRYDIMWSSFSKFFFKDPKDAVRFKLRFG